VWRLVEARREALFPLVQGAAQQRARLALLRVCYGLLRRLSRSADTVMCGRILLFLAFVPAGWHHAMNWTQFEGADAERLRQLGVRSAVVARGGEALVRLEAPSAEQAATVSSDGSVLQARSLHELTLELDRKGMPKPYIAAWVVAIFELIGGGLLLVGLFSRVWAGGIAFWAVALFGLSSWQAINFSDLWATNVPARASMIGLVTIATLALGIAFSGAGAFSLDAMIFRKGGGGGGGGDDGGE
jgi:uncharacterized membrane protein YphA (DoxX/SURF4 family)